MFGLGIPEILAILVVVLILFGAGKLPQVMGDLGKGLKSFKDEMDGKAKVAAKPVAGKKVVAKVAVKAAKGKKPVTKVKKK